MTCRLASQPRFLAAVPVRAFGPKRGGAKGGPPVPEYKETKFSSAMSEFINIKGEDAFPLGPPKGANKIYQAHRDYVLPKLSPTIEFLAKKFREQYVREAIYPDVKIFLDPLRERRPEDTLQKLRKEKLVAGVINARDEFDDVDLVFPHRTPFTITKTDHGLVRPFHVRFNDEEIMVTHVDMTQHLKTREYLHIEF